jgi:3-hydroxybutyryl-CoA dehydratase
VDASVEITELSEKGRRAKLRCECRVGETLVLEGEAEVKIPARPAANEAPIP